MKTRATPAQLAVDDLRLSVHTPDSWARAIAAAALEVADNNDAFPDSPVTIDAKIVVARHEGPTDHTKAGTFFSVCLQFGQSHQLCVSIHAD